MIIPPDEDELFGDSIDEAIDRFLARDDSEQDAPSEDADDAPDDELQDAALEAADDLSAEIDEPEDDDQVPNESLQREAAQVAEEVNEAGDVEETDEEALIPAPDPDLPQVTEEEAIDEPERDPMSEMRAHFDAFFEERETGLYQRVQEMIDSSLDMSVRRR